MIGTGVAITNLPRETLDFIAESPSSERIPIELPTNSLQAKVSAANSTLDPNIGKKVLLTTQSNNQIIGIGTYTGRVEDKVNIASFDLQKQYVVEKVIFDKADQFSQRPLQKIRLLDFENYVTQIRKKLPIVISL